jgi:thioredoxin reductase (NADPH)
VLTAEEIAGVSIFAGLSGGACDRLARLAADVRLAPGEYAVHAQEKRVLFAVLEGRLETVNMVDGILRVVGGRGPGELVGEVPIALGTTFPFGFRAVEPTRLMRLEAEDYHAAVAQAPKVGERLGALARERIGYLQGITADTPPPPPSSAIFSTETRSRSGGSPPTPRMANSCGATPCRPTRTSR